MIRMLISLYAVPCLLLVLGLLLVFFGSANFSGELQEGHFAPLADMAIKYTYMLADILFGASVLWIFVASIRLYRWEQGKGASCPSCGGMVTERDGRYGPYMKCLACGRNSKRALE